MLTLRPQLPPTRPPDAPLYQTRGRSRKVSQVALARQASEERHIVSHHAPLAHSERVLPPPGEKSMAKPIFDASPGQHMNVITPEHPSLPPLVPTSFIPSSLSPSPPDSALMSPNYYDSPPSPPRSLEDQVHVAYALDDIHLAKVLLLRLKGINVTSDDDPRIAAVKDEDFDFCFVPYGRLVFEEDEKLVAERQRKEMEMLEKRQRAERLKACERIWVQEKRRLREAMELVSKRREEDARRQAEQENRVRERAEVAEVERRSRLSKQRPQVPSRNLVSYKIGSSSSQDPAPFVYDFMIAPPIKRPRMLSRPPFKLPSTSSSPFSRPLFDASRTVSFSEVLTSMEGHLFPPEPQSADLRFRNSSKRRRENELFTSLVKVIEWEEEDGKRRKGKAPERLPVRRRNGARSTTSVPCAVCSSFPTRSSLTPSSSSSLSLTPLRRSWLSFSSASSSASTAATSPSNQSASLARKGPKTWFVTSASAPSLSTPVPSSSPSPLHSCGHLTPVSLAESPLSLRTLAKHPAVHYSSHTNSRSTFHYAGASGLSDTTAPARLMMKRVSHFIELAKTFRTTYMNAKVSSITASSEALANYAVDSRTLNTWRTRNGNAKLSRNMLNPPGQRVRPADVAVFLSPSIYTRRRPPQPILAPPVPLRSRNTILDSTPRTILPYPLPYPVRFKPLPVPCRSPFRLHARLCLTQDADDNDTDTSDAVYTNPMPSGVHTMASGMVLRVRAVENPVYLRMKAVHNVVREYGGGVRVGRVKDGMLGAGKERVLQIAFEGLGRSWLGVEGVFEREDGIGNGFAIVEKTRGRGRERGKEWW